MFVAVQDEAKRRLTSRARSALRRIGARRVVSDYRGSMAMIGHTGGLSRKYIRKYIRTVSNLLVIMIPVLFGV